MEQERELLKTALKNGDIIYNSRVNENVYSISNEALPEIINEWVNKYPETVEELAENFNAEKDPSKPIKFCTRNFIENKRTKHVRLEVYPTLNSEELNCSEKCFEYEFKVYHKKNNKNQYQLKKIIQNIGIIADEDKDKDKDKEQNLERLIEKEENLQILLNLATSNNITEN
jgi:hypothetical protein